MRVAIIATRSTPETAVESSLIVVSADAYLVFVRQLVARHRNAPIAEALVTERAHLRPLPRAAIPSYTTYTVTVRCWSTVTVGKRVYSVPSRLRGHEVEVRQHADTLDIRYADLASTRTSATPSSLQPGSWV